jgi:hypothetical protein
MSWIEGASLFILWVGRTGVFNFQGWCGEWTVHCSLSTWTVKFSCEFFLIFKKKLEVFGFWGEGVKAKNIELARHLI